MLLLTIALGIASNASVDGFVRGLALYGQQSGDRVVTPELMAALDRIGQLLRIAALAVFVIACGNVVSFMLSRASARSRETAVRVAIGAGRAQLVRQVLADSIVLAVTGAAAGAVFAFWIAQIVPALLFDQDADHMIFALDRDSVLLITIACASVTVACGLLPLIDLRHDRPGAVMQREASGPSRASIRLRAGLVIVQMTACTLLVISAGLLLAGFRSALQTTAGRRLSAAIVVSVETLQTSSKAVERSSGLQYFDATARAAREVAGATSMAWAATVPGNRPVWQAFEFETPDLPVRPITLVSTPFTKGTFETLITPPIAGRLFGIADGGPCGGVVVTVEAAKMLAGGQALKPSEMHERGQVSAGDLTPTMQGAINQGLTPNVYLGRSIETPAGEWVEIVGVVAALDDPTPRVYHYMPDAAEPYPAPERATYRALRYGGSQRTDLDVNIVSPNYFEFMGLPIAKGREFDATPGACRVAVVNEQAEALYFNGDAAGGAVIDARGRRTSIVGVVGSNQLRASQRPVQPAIYFPMEQDFLFRMTMIAETGGVTAGVLRQLHRRLEMIPGGREDKIVVKTLDDHLSRTAYAPERIATVLVGASAAIALVLGGLGLYGVDGEAARRRRREFAVRLALGAHGWRVVRQLMAEGCAWS